MTSIDLNTPESALAYLRSLLSATAIELPGAHESRSYSAAADAVSVIVGQPANSWATAMNRWEWTAGELATALAQTVIHHDSTR